MENNNCTRECTCTFTGHREEKLPWGKMETDSKCIEIKERIFVSVEAAYKTGYRHFICGMATGCDMYFCEAVIELRESHPEITIEAAIPFEKQSANWRKNLRDRYYRLIEDCDYRTLIQSKYSPGCFMRRNRYMVDHSSLLIAAYNGTQGGTMNTMLYAMRKDIQIVEIPIE